MPKSSDQKIPSTLTQGTIYVGEQFCMEVCSELSCSYLWLSPAEHYCMPNSMHMGVVEILTEE